MNERKKITECAVDECRKPIRARGRCNTHYQTLYRKGLGPWVQQRSRPPRHNLTNRRFGRLTAVGVANGPFQDYRRGYRWVCSCDCGNIHVVAAHDLLNGRIVSCGCYNKEVNAARCRSGVMQKTTHGLSPAGNRHPLYGTWAAMWNRCRSPKHDYYHRYGGRGITVCDRWKDFALFVADVGTKPSPTHTLDRYPDPDGNYEPGNVRWATKAEQVSNRSTVVSQRMVSA